MPLPSASMNIFSVAGSAMTAQSQRMNVTASNLANAESVAGPDGQPPERRDSSCCLCSAHSAASQR